MIALLDLRSGLRGLRAMRRGHASPARWTMRRRRGWWLHLWTPSWHEGRGPYLSVGLGLVAVYRGY